MWNNQKQQKVVLRYGWMNISTIFDGYSYLPGSELDWVSAIIISIIIMIL